jgi:hypothetical protein
LVETGGIIGVVVVLLVAILPAACVTACYCTESNCPVGENLSDYIFFISWAVVVGTATLLSLVLSGFVLRKMGNFKEKHRERIRRFSIFFLLCSVSMVLLVAFIVVLFVAESVFTSPDEV